MRSYITSHDIANEIRMTRSSHQGCFLIVEGSTDKKAYSHFINSEDCKIIPAHNKENAIGAIKILEDDEFLAALAIVDADFWRLEHKKISLNVFLTDGHDLEVMMIKSPALDKVLMEFGSSEKIARFIRKHKTDVRQKLLDLGRTIGYLRWVSLQHNLNLKFEGLKFKKFINERELSFNRRAFLKTVINHSRMPHIREDELQQMMDELTSSTHDPYDVCCGHDLVYILSLGLTKALGSEKAQDVRPEQLEKILRVAYESAYFLTTDLYQSLKAWQISHPQFKLLKNDL